MDAADLLALRRALLRWYDSNARDLPWRVRPAARETGARADPYRVWLSEVMLQQTTVPHATPYFLAFTARWPTVGGLAAAEDGAVMGAWAGLGYYARARNLLACARAVASRPDGGFPDTEAGLRALPGLGPYTAAAVAAIAFDRPAVAVDGNVERVTARLYAVETPLPDAKPELREHAAEMLSHARPGDWTQAVMDLGATICRPKTPLCERCPVSSFCAALASGRTQTLPRKRAKAEQPRRYGVAYVAERAGRVARVRRPASGLLGGMIALPTSAWGTEPIDDAAARDAAPAAGDWRCVGEVEHVFTHFALTLRVFRAEVMGDVADATWTAVAEAGEGMPSVFAKALRRGMADRDCSSPA